MNKKVVSYTIKITLNDKLVLKIVKDFVHLLATDGKHGVDTSTIEKEVDYAINNWYKYWQCHISLGDDTDIINRTISNKENWSELDGMYKPMLLQHYDELVAIAEDVADVQFLWAR